MLKFLKELTRRKVWLFGGIYLALGWVVLQVAIAIEATMMLPDWIDQSVLVLLGLGFPFALLLAWAQESQGKAGKPDARTGEPVKQAHSRLAIAVLPFADMSPDGDQEWFSDGISEEILHRLAAEKELNVAGRTSSFHFKGKTASFEEIGAILSVGSVLEGSVRKMDNRVRITAQLIEVATGYHIWSGTFDRELEDIFRIQEDISEAIATALLREIGLTASEPQEMPHEPNAASYQALLKGHQFYRTPGASQQDSEDAVEWYERAADLDSEYSVPWAYLCAAIAFNQGPGGVLPDGYRDIDALVAKGLASNPSPAEAAYIKALGTTAHWRYSEADRHFREWESLGGHPQIRNLSHASLLTLTGRWHRARPILEAMMATEPLDSGHRNWLFRVYTCLGEHELAKRLAEDSKALGFNPTYWDYNRCVAQALLGDISPLDKFIATTFTSSDDEETQRPTADNLSWLKSQALLIKGHVSQDREALLLNYDDLVADRETGRPSWKLRDLAETCVLLDKDDEALKYYTEGLGGQYVDFRSVLKGPPDWPPRLFLTRDPRGRALMEKSGWDLAWFDEEKSST